ncbi:CPBP family intramembrane glutamic endopeptidase [Microbacterium hydrocarbonoxydans]|uniref:CPBP family intramembrane glutamic endopeptidase n=1 Tax=Microbacterium hydrocarbonoxydans TaxID=273678 RepID=UPI00203C2A93|nr:CPBP family intramembrane glutamic endopeptidase [Microbacterium hydrocarbonoxydans]MCM3779711.1 CPBP family intramembrane metalloprotease [Microbacterium hydrocarbonoxydans]
MTDPGTLQRSTSATRRVAPRVWMGIVALIGYVLFAAALGNVLGGLAGEGDDLGEFALSHLVPLPVAIAVAVVFIRWAGWSGPVWRETPTFRLTPHRRWLLAIPVCALLIPLGEAFTVPWADRAVSFVLVVALGTLMVGLGEELVCRGILLVSLRERHGELVTLLGTAALFALAHVYSSIWHGLQPATVAFQVAALAMSGVTYYWIRRVTGRLWVGVLVHAFTDFVLYVGSEAGNSTEAMGATVDTGNPVSVTAQVLLAALAAISIVSVIREDRRSRRRAA